MFASTRKTLPVPTPDLYQKTASGTGVEELLLESSQVKLPTDLSADGRFLLYNVVDPKTGYDLWAMPLSGDRKPFPVVSTRFDERVGQFSPDSNWIAYQSNESGRFEIYVQPFPGPGVKSPVSASGGVQPRWRKDGKELFYVALDGKLISAPITLSASGQRIAVGKTSTLFTTRLASDVSLGPEKQQYAVWPDGQRFLMNATTEEQVTTPITLILNWKPKH